MIAIVDYGMGNLHSVRHALATVGAGADAKITSDPKDLERAERIVFPGVGAFGECMKNIRASGLLPTLEREVLEKRKPMFGICVGMQVLASVGEELGTHEGLGWIPGRVRRLKGDGVRVPHVGWNDARVIATEHPVFRDLPRDSTFYYVHSFVFEPESRAHVAAVCDYGEEFVCALAKDNIIATQFHPEKSQDAGLTLLERFLRWNP
ncbi:MAG TPA: imidazole glycerol phosphate synthase subunit HisH [Labilithrix sp.]|nr:imidazole glycerol phosphate synthase subunit HisH [Labilithrix sp.]